MIAKRSSLDLAEFILINQQYQFTFPPEEEESGAIMADYIVDIDFSINSLDNQVFQLYVSIGVNREKLLSGYTIYSEGVGFFDFSKSPKLTIKEKRDFLQFSGISICINQLRSIIGSLTAHGPFGKYLLPAIDVNDLLAQKMKIFEKENKSKVKNK